MGNNHLEQAIISAIEDVEKINIGATTVSVAPEHLVSLADIAERISMSRQAVSLFMLGERGAGEFPQPVLKIASKSPLWLWSQVSEWLYQHGKIHDYKIIQQAKIIESINTALELRNNSFFENGKELFLKLKNQTIENHIY